MSERVYVSIEVNGNPIGRWVEPRLSLVDFLRQELELIGTHAGCEMGVCGACLVLLEGEAAHSCLMFAVQVDGLRVETIEGLSERSAVADLQAAFLERNALQCGFCTPGMLVTAHQLLAAGGRPSREAIREALSGNYCRCTGYHAIVDAVESVAKAREDAASAQPSAEPSPEESAV